jgi:hypothetical protein
MSKWQYRVIKQYIAYLEDMPVLLPVGTLLTFWDERGFYLSEPVNTAYAGVCAPVSKWAVEAWHNYFEKIEPAPNVTDA